MRKYIKYLCSKWYISLKYFISAQYEYFFLRNDITHTMFILKEKTDKLT